MAAGFRPTRIPENPDHENTVRATVTMAPNWGVELHQMQEDFMVTPTPYTIHPAPYTLDPTPYTLDPLICPLAPTPKLLNTTHQILHPTP